MERSRDTRAPLRALAVAFVVSTTVASASDASGASTTEAAQGAPALQRARAAWDKGSIEAAEPLYREALEKGGLAPSEVLEGYVRLGSIRAAIGKKDQAIAAFRAASILDPSFAIPTEAGPKGATFAAQAKKDTAKIGGIKLSLTAPKETPSGKPFRVTATLDSAHLAIVTKFVVVARDGTSGKEATIEAKPEAVVDLEVPSDVTLPSASLAIRLDALDSHNNRLATSEERVHVEGESAVAATTPSTASSSASSDPSTRKGGGFWSSPWPYVIGGAALAGAGAAFYFGTRPSDQVTVGAVDVRAR